MRDKSRSHAMEPAAESVLFPEERSAVPRRPGVYVFRDAKRKILYVGKAKDLRSRLNSYFQKSSSLDERKKKMIRLVRGFSYIVTGGEIEALALEANLIKQHRPRFNIVLRDDKNYPYLKLTVKEEWPRIEVVRRVVKDGSKYFGPYVQAGSMWEALDFIRRHFGLRPCRYALDRPMRPCVQHQMGRCPAPCAGKIGKEEYGKIVGDVELFLRGRKRELLRAMEEEMKRASDDLRFEYAARLRDRIAALEQALERQKVIAPELGDIDVVGLYREDGEAALAVLIVKDGIMIGARDYFLRHVEGLPTSDLLHGFIEMFYARSIVPPGEIVLGEGPSEAGTLREWLAEKRGAGVKFVVPKTGKRAELLQMAAENARLMFESRRGRAGTGDGVLDDLREMLGLEARPESIGAFDVSTIGGSEAVGAFVYFSGEGFVKDYYRHVKIKGVAGVDDYAMMGETVERVLKEEAVIPDMVVIDGGRGHLAAGLAAVGRAVAEDVRPLVISVAKEPDRAFVPWDGEGSGGGEFPLEGSRPAALLLRRIRDEVHRFAIGFHRKLRGRRLLESPLESVPGIGKRRRVALLRHFGSIDAIRTASVEELSAVPGMNRPAAQAVAQEIKGNL